MSKRVPSPDQEVPARLPEPEPGRCSLCSVSSYQFPVPSSLWCPGLGRRRGMQRLFQHFFYNFVVCVQKLDEICCQPRSECSAVVVAVAVVVHVVVLYLIYYLCLLNTCTTNPKVARATHNGSNERKGRPREQQKQARKRERKQERRQQSRQQEEQQQQEAHRAQNNSLRCHGDMQ